MKRIRISASLLILFSAFTGALVLPSLVAAQTGIWVPTGNMTTKHLYGTATLLQSGKVLVAGGITTSDGRSTISTAELFDPTTGKWTRTASMNVGRNSHTATLMLDGRVLVAGGNDKTGNALSSAEIYDPLLEQWTLTGTMNAPRATHAAALIETGIDTGKVIVIAGSSQCASCEPNLSTEIYDPSSAAWTKTADLHVARYYTLSNGTATIPDGSIMTVGGGTCCPYGEANEERLTLRPQAVGHPQRRRSPGRTRRRRV
jgi:hypothetical protein